MVWRKADCLVSINLVYQPIKRILKFLAAVSNVLASTASVHIIMSKKRRREQPAIDVQLVEIYEDLANVDEDVRLKAAQALLTNFVADGKSTGEQLNEIVRRLLRGLCSGRKVARLGFSIALTELLTELLGSGRKDVAGFQNTLEVIKTLTQQSHVSGNVSGQVCVSGDSSSVSIVERNVNRKNGIMNLDDSLEQNLSSSREFCFNRAWGWRLGLPS